MAFPFSEASIDVQVQATVLHSAVGGIGFLSSSFYGSGNGTLWLTYGVDNSGVHQVKASLINAYIPAWVDTWTVAPGRRTIRVTVEDYDSTRARLSFYDDATVLGTHLILKSVVNAWQYAWMTLFASHPDGGIEWARIYEAIITSGSARTYGWDDVTEEDAWLWKSSNVPPLTGGYIWSGLAGTNYEGNLLKWAGGRKVAMGLDILSRPVVWWVNGDDRLERVQHDVRAANPAATTPVTEGGVPRSPSVHFAPDGGEHVWFTVEQAGVLHAASRDGGETFTMPVTILAGDYELAEVVVRGLYAWVAVHDGTGWKLGTTWYDQATGAFLPLDPGDLTTLVAAADKVAGRFQWTPQGVLLFSYVQDGDAVLVMCKNPSVTGAGAWS